MYVLIFTKKTALRGGFFTKKAASNYHLVQLGTISGAITMSASAAHNARSTSLLSSQQQRAPIEGVAQI
jgi:hypothetical protein